MPPAPQKLRNRLGLPRCLRTPAQRSEIGRARLGGGDTKAEPEGEPHDEETLDEGAR